MLTLFWTFPRIGHVPLLGDQFRSDPRDGPVRSKLFFPAIPLPSATIMESKAIAVAQAKPIARDGRSLAPLERQNPTAYNFWVKYFFDDPSPVESYELEEALRSHGLPFNNQLAGLIGPTRFRIMVMGKGRLAKFFPSGERRMDDESSVSSGEDTGDCAFPEQRPAYTNIAYVPTDSADVSTGGCSSSAPAGRLSSSGQLAYTPFPGALRPVHYLTPKPIPRAIAPDARLIR
ncbi:hypothetical protein BDK51DRAFT_39151 [Blyttiomyces helicus]|uniref:Uncharacterized protein n=1 Tax=Blyttiomyces helicus TaxID=388810 RepID=A0A4P9WGW0_9FUNG|nr:hypothetical protein BDK51DRAFT_39151 [Blyttiomyces helicus]|eukprot:RKO90618.1 hypothetical protein BDK51DRAFT_39151 [Blyttiomyces helicus]